MDLFYTDWPSLNLAIGNSFEEVCTLDVMNTVCSRLRSSFLYFIKRVYLIELIAMSTTTAMSEKHV